MIRFSKFSLKNLFSKNEILEKKIIEKTHKEQELEYFKKELQVLNKFKSDIEFTVKNVDEKNIKIHIRLLINNLNFNQTFNKMMFEFNTE